MLIKAFYRFRIATFCHDVSTLVSTEEQSLTEGCQQRARQYVKYDHSFVAGVMLKLIITSEMASVHVGHSNVSQLLRRGAPASDVNFVMEILNMQQYA